MTEAGPRPPLDDETLRMARQVFQWVRAGADPQLCNDRGQTPQAGAAFKGALDAVGVLLDHGATVEAAARPAP